LVYLGPNTVGVKEVSEAEESEGRVRLKVKYCGVCGSDISIYMGVHARAKAPLILGHEFLGEVMQDGCRFKKGDRVTAYPLISCGLCLPCRTGNAHACNSLRLLGIDQDGGACAYMWVDEAVLFRVPDAVPDKAAAVIEPLAVVVRALHQSGLRALDTVLVTGAGPIGMLTGLLLRHAGAAKVMISDINPKRLARAEALGMIPIGGDRDAAAFVRDATDGEGADILYECSGAESVALHMCDMVRVGGTICMVSMHKAPHKVDLQTFSLKEQRMTGTRVYTKEEFRQAVHYAAAISGELEQVVSHVIPLADSAGVFDLIADPDSDSVKVLIDCGQS